MKKKEKKLQHQQPRMEKLRMQEEKQEDGRNLKSGLVEKQEKQ